MIFLQYLDASPQIWHTLVHVCQNWRRTVFTSPRTLQLRLYCKHGTPVLKNLDCWPALPIIIQYGGSSTLDPPSSEDEDNVVAALKQSDRVNSIDLTITKSLLEKFSLIKEPFSDLEHLVLLSQNPTGLALPSTFKWGSRLRLLHSTGMALPALPHLLSPSLDLVDLQLHEVPNAGYFSPEEFASALSGMTRLQSLSLHFLSPASRPSHISPPPSPGERVVLPALTQLKFRGASEYLNSLAAKINIPGLVAIDVRFFSQLIFHISQLGQFFDRIEMQKSHRRADILFSGRAVSITFTPPDAHARLTLQISCEQLDWQLSSIVQIFDQIFPILSSVQDLRIDTTERSSEVAVGGEEWVELIRGFDGAEDFHVTGELAADILLSLRAVDGEHPTVLPSLCKLRVREFVSSTIQGPLLEAMQSLITSRTLSGHPVQEYLLPPIHVQEYPLPPIDGAIEEMQDNKIDIAQHAHICSQCHIRFTQRQALHRHIKDQHQPRLKCTFCTDIGSSFSFSRGRPYLYRRHLQLHHPGASPPAKRRS
jgi:hypothetical protein